MLIAFGNVMGTPALLTIFVASVVVSIVLLTRRKRAFHIPIIGALAMIGSAIAWFFLVSAGLAA